MLTHVKNDCNDAGGIGRNLGGSGFGTPFVLHDKDGNPLAGIMGTPGDELSSECFSAPSSNNHRN